jgi:hypothetical protein
MSICDVDFRDFGELAHVCATVAGKIAIFLAL